MAAVPTSRAAQPRQDSERLLNRLVTTLGPQLCVKWRADARDDGPDLACAGCGARLRRLSPNRRLGEYERTGQYTDYEEATIHGDVSAGI